MIATINKQTLITMLHTNTEAICNKYINDKTLGYKPNYNDVVRFLVTNTTITNEDNTEAMFEEEEVLEFFSDFALVLYNTDIHRGALPFIFARTITLRNGQIVDYIKLRNGYTAYLYTRPYTVCKKRKPRATRVV